MVFYSGGRGKESAVARACSSSSDSGKYVRYTEEQVEALEKVYKECPKPNSFKRQQLLREYPILSNIEPKQIKVWFQNRRCREKQRKESTRLLALNDKLTAMNKVLVKQNDSLSQQAMQLMRLNHDLRHQLKTMKDKTVTKSLSGKDEKALSGGSAMNTWKKRPIPQPPPWDVNPARLMALAEECLSEFLAKATGTGVDWIQIPGMKPGPDSIGIVAVGHGCEGVAARACSLIGMESSRVSDVLKDRLSWLPDCHRVEILGAFTTSSGATVELLYTQMYSPTCLTQPRDFCTIRYTTVLEDRNLVVCERSLSLATLPSNEGFVRGEVLSSGYLIRPCGGVGSIVYIVDHLDQKAEYDPEVLRPMYKSSDALAQNVTVVALRHLRSLAQEAAGEAITGGTLQPAAIRALSLRISRGFNDAINSFSEDGWVIVSNDGPEDVIMALNSSWDPRVMGLKCFSSSSGCGNVLCAKASMLLQNIRPAMFIRFLREHRSEWAVFDTDAGLSEVLRTHVYGASALAGTEIGRREVPMPLAHSIEHQELMELVKFEGQSSSREGPLVSKETYLLQLCSGVNETFIGDSGQLVFAPVDGAISDDIPLLPSGFRVALLNPGFMDGRYLPCTQKEASTSETCSDVDAYNSDDSECVPTDSKSIVTIAFQFGYETHDHDSVLVAARKYIQSIVASFQRIAMAMAPRIGSSLALSKFPAADEALNLVKLMVASYSANFGMHFLWKKPSSNDELFQMVWNHSDAVICCKCEVPSGIVFANEAAMNMLEVTPATLQDLTWDQTFSESEKENASLDISNVVQKGFTYLPGGVKYSRSGRAVSYDRALAWKVLDQDADITYVAFIFSSLSF